MQEMVIYGVSFDMVGKQPIVLLKTVAVDVAVVGAGELQQLRAPRRGAG